MEARLSDFRMRFLIRKVVRTSRLSRDLKLRLDFLDSVVVPSSRCDCLWLKES